MTYSEILFATGNDRKITEANKTLKDFNITVNPVKIDIDEIQHSDSAEITKAKARAAFFVTKEPVVVSDTSWEIPALGGFPGGYMKDVSAWFAAEDWISLMSQYSDRTIYCHEHLAYFDGKELQHFVSSYEGRFIDKVRGQTEIGESIEQVVSLYGDTDGGMTMAEYIERGEIASVGTELPHWQNFGEWYLRRSDNDKK